MASGPAFADPIITPLVTTALASVIGEAAVGFTLGATGITLGALASTLVVGAIGLGLALALAPRPKVPTPEAGAISVLQTTPYRVFGYGRARVAGAIMLKEASATNLYQVQALTGHRIDAFEALWLNDDQVNVPISGNRLVGIVTAGSDGRYGSSAIAVDSRLGLATETAYSAIVADLPSQWTNNHRGDNCASIAFKFFGQPLQNFANVYPYGASAPSPSAVLRLAKVFDPRNTAQNVNDPTTWQWSANTALAILHFLCFSEFGSRIPYGDAILPVVDAWIAAANACDDDMPLKAGGTEKRYRLGGWTTTEQTRATTLLAMLQSCDGVLIRRGRSWLLIVGKYQEPSVFILDADIAGFTIQSNVATEDKVNEGIARYTSPDNGYVTVDTDPVEDIEDQAARGGAPRKAQLELPWVQSPGQASRLLKREMIRQKAVRGQVIVHWSGLNAVYERWVGISSNTIPRLAGAVIEVRKAVNDPSTRTATIDFIVSGPGIDDYDPNVDETSPPVIPQRPVSVGLPIPSNVDAIGVLRTDVSGASSVVFDVTWDLPYNGATPWNLNYVVQWRIADIGGGVPGNWSQQTFPTPTAHAGRITVETNAVTVGSVYELQVSSVGTTSNLSTWSAIETVSTVLANLSPSAPTWISAVGGTGSAVLTVKAPPSPNFASVQFYRAAHAASFSTAIAVGSPVTGSPNATLGYTDTVAAGSYDYYAESRTSAPVSSAPAGPQTATVT